MNSLQVRHGCARLTRIASNDALCGGGIEPEETSTAYLLFDVRRGSHFAFIDLYDGDSKAGDDLGNTRLRMHLAGFPGA